VAKYDEKLFGALVTQAKGLSNRGTLRVVFVSSDGSVIPLLQKYAAINRMDTIKEVLDISSEDVLKYLAHFGITGSKANRIVNLVGGRLAYLSTSRNIVKRDADMSDDAQLDKIDRTVFGLMRTKQRRVINLFKSNSTMILQMVSNKGKVDPADITDLLKEGEEEIRKIESCIQEMVNVNILRFNTEGDITWYDDMQKRLFSTQ